MAAQQTRPAGCRCAPWPPSASPAAAPAWVAPPNPLWHPPRKTPQNPPLCTYYPHPSGQDLRQGRGGGQEGDQGAGRAEGGNTAGRGCCVCSAVHACMHAGVAGQGRVWRCGMRRETCGRGPQPWGAGAGTSGGWVWGRQEASAEDGAATGTSMHACTTHPHQPPMPISTPGAPTDHRQPTNQPTTNQPPANPCVCVLGAPYCYALPTTRSWCPPTLRRRASRWTASCLSSTRGTSR